MRSAVYNRYWATGGGAEKYGGVVAELLSADGPVDLLTHEPFDRDWLAERLALDLSRCEVRCIADTPRAFTTAAAEPDLFVNVSFMSREPAPTRHSLYVVHFPTALDAHLPGWKRTMIRRGGSFLHRALPVSFEWGTGFHHRDPGRRAVSWTEGDAVIRIITDPGRPVAVRLAFGFQRPAEAGPADLRILVDGREVVADDLADPPTGRERMLGRSFRFDVVSPAPDVAVEVRILSSTFKPAELLGGDDQRTLGVPLMSLQLGNSAWAMAARFAPVLLTQPLSNRFAGTYGRVVSNSAFTRRWVQRRWDVDSEVLFPPVTLYAPADKDQSILSVGRFFGADQGHSKCQLELVTAFRELVDSGLVGWTLHLVGGVAGEGNAYLDAVRARAAGYPVEIHANAAGADLVALYGRAPIYWHAAGFGVNPERHPDVVEHFGISTVEAMSAGAVPAVLGVGGLVETVRHGVDGYHFRSLGGLAAMTRSLIDDEAMRARMSASARARAATFGIDAFADRLARLVAAIRDG